MVLAQLEIRLFAFSLFLGLQRISSHSLGVVHVILHQKRAAGDVLEGSLPGQAGCNSGSYAYEHFAAGT